MLIDLVIAYVLMGVFFASMGLCGMLDSGKDRKYMIRITFGLLFFWPFMIGYVLILALAFIVFGGLF